MEIKTTENIVRTAVGDIGFILEGKPNEKCVFIHEFIAYLSKIWKEEEGKLLGVFIDNLEELQ